ncbi:MAG: copper chaperone PCu(A)C [Gammaproteobacteria bacterium]|nr:copper chaperone PCu(A)C [Gammaproteobacteria bacterium]
MTTISLSSARLSPHISPWRRQPGVKRGSRAAAKLLFLLPLLCACTRSAAIETSETWIREAPPGAERLAAYLVIKNNLSSAITLTGASSDSFATVQIHRTTMRDGVARMRMIGELAIGPDQSQSLSPGGTHLMLINPKEDFVAGDIVCLVLHFAGQPDLVLGVPVKAGR